MKLVYPLAKSKSMDENLRIIGQAEELIEAGKTAEAQKLLEPYIETHLHNVEAWLLEAETWPTIEGRIKVLELCLRHNRNNIAVQSELESLQSKGKSTFPETPRPAPAPSPPPETAPAAAVAPKRQGLAEKWAETIRQRIQGK